MGFIYIIRNDINEKVYIGKTQISLEKRFKEHCRDSNKRRSENRPLYRAMKKYGTNHFMIELIEECKNENLEDREVFWIDHFGSYKNGYNATKGGDGKPYLDLPEREICSIYLSGIAITNIAKRFGCDSSTIRKLLIKNNINLRGKIDSSLGSTKLNKPVNQIDLKTGKIINTFKSVTDALKH